MSLILIHSQKVLHYEQRDEFCLILVGLKLYTMQTNHKSFLYDF